MSFCVRLVGCAAFVLGGGLFAMLCEYAIAGGAYFLQGLTFQGLLEFVWFLSLG